MTGAQGQRTEVFKVSVSSATAGDERRMRLVKTGGHGEPVLPELLKRRTIADLPALKSMQILLLEIRLLSEAGGG